jgi:predicted Zn-dependent protease
MKLPLYDCSSGLLKAVGTLLCLLALGFDRQASTQPVKLPFTDPAKMFEQMFGEDAEEDRLALEKVEVSVDEERQLGQQLVQGALALLKESGIAVETNGRDVEYLQSLVATMQPFMKNKIRYKSIRVLLARSPRIDARSYPGGTLIFFDGLFDAVDSEAALVGIVGHELSHLDRGHQLLPIKRIKLMEKSFSSPRNMMQFMPSQPGMAKLWARPFRPEDERDADRDGVAWSCAAGYDPRELAKLFQKIQKKGATSPGVDEMPWATFFRSHPNSEERHDAIMKQYNQAHKKKPKLEPLFIGRQNLINRISRKQVED